MCPESAEPFGPPPQWTLVTSHGLVLLYVSTHPMGTIREIAGRLALTERRVNDLIQDLVGASLVEVKREGRRNLYSLSSEARFRHPFIEHIPFQSFVALWKLTLPQPELDDRPPLD